jgi:hypothetical protein
VTELVTALKVLDLVVIPELTVLDATVNLVDGVVFSTDREVEVVGEPEFVLLVVPTLDPVLLLLGGLEPPSCGESAWATPDPLASAAPTPRVSAPTPSQVPTSGWR